MTAGLPLVSIGIPAYARPVELRRAIKSVLDQGLAEVEVVVGDDSGDLETVVRDIGDDRVVYFRNTPRLGMAGNWNAVLDRSKGRYVGLLMDDDYLMPGFLPSVLDRFADWPDVGWVCTDHLFSDGTRTWGRSCALTEGRYDASVHTVLRHQAAAVSATVVRRDVWDAIRPLPDLLTADLVMHVRIAHEGYPMFYVDQPLMTYVVHPGQQSSTSPRFRSDRVHALEMFTFAEPRAEKLRRQRLAQARVSVGAAHLRAGEFTEARQTLHDAREFGPGPAGARGLALTLLARQPTVARWAVAAWRRRPGSATS